MARRKKAKGTLQRESDPTRWAHLIFALGGFMGYWVLSNAIEDLWAVAWGYWPTMGRPDALDSSIAAMVVATLATLYAWRRADWFKFCTEVVVEISQVTWPTKSETRQATVVVIVMTLICSGMLWAMDQIWSQVTNWLYGI